jgi:hypothetical protein
MTRTFATTSKTVLRNTIDSSTSHRIGPSIYRVGQASDNAFTLQLVCVLTNEKSTTDSGRADNGTSTSMHIDEHEREQRKDHRADINVVPSF